MDTSEVRPAFERPALHAAQDSAAGFIDRGRTAAAKRKERRRRVPAAPIAPHQRLSRRDDVEAQPLIGTSRQIREGIERASASLSGGVSSAALDDRTDSLAATRRVLGSILALASPGAFLQDGETRQDGDTDGATPTRQCRGSRPCKPNALFRNSQWISPAKLATSCVTSSGWRGPKPWKTSSRWAAASPARPSAWRLPAQRLRSAYSRWRMRSVRRCRCGRALSSARSSAAPSLTFSPVRPQSRIPQSRRAAAHRGASLARRSPHQGDTRYGMENRSHRADVNQSRHRLNDTIEALARAVAGPNAGKPWVWPRAKGRFRRQARPSSKGHPLPALLIAAGVGLLFLNRNSGRRTSGRPRRLAP